MIGEDRTVASWRAGGARRVLVCCCNNRCWHVRELALADLPQDVTLAALRPRLVCTGCGLRQVELRPSVRDHYEDHEARTGYSLRMS